MTTSKNRVAAYISDEIYERLCVFMDQRNIRSVSEALSVILHEFLEYKSEALDDNRADALESRIAVLEQQSLSFRDELSKIKSSLEF